MSYFRRGVGDDEGPITHPSQVDDSIIIGTVPPTRVSCENLSADSPFRRPGQVCGPPAPGPLDFLKNLFPWKPTSSTPTPVPATTTSSSASPILILGAAGALYYLLRSRKGS